MKHRSELQELLADFTMPADPALVRKEIDGAIRCLACANRCRIVEGKAGICCVRMHRDGELRVPGGYVAGMQVDPIEKKPFFHVFPGRDALSFGMLGCNYHCPFCQNWISSQVLQDDASTGTPHIIKPERLVATAVDEGTPVIVSTYNEPLITADWAAKIFEKAREHGIVCGFVSNGHATPEVIAFLRPLMQLFKVDLKCFTEEGYAEVGGKLKAVLDTIASLKEQGFWVEVVTLVIPGFNDDNAQLNGIARFVAGVSPDIPWHVTAFHPDYKMRDRGPTRASEIQRAIDAGHDAGLHFVYAGNMPGAMGSVENTFCPSCQALLIEREGFSILNNCMAGGQCPDCGAFIPGYWEADPVRRSTGLASPRRPR